MKLLQAMLRREVERLTSPIYKEYRAKLEHAVANEPVLELVNDVQIVTSELNHTASPRFRAMAKMLEEKVQKVMALYNVDNSHDIAQSWSKRTYDKLLETFKKAHDVTVKQTGHSFEISATTGTRTRTCFVRLRQPFVEVRYAGLLQQYGSDQEVELNTVMGNALADLRNEARKSTYQARTTPHWTENAYAKVIGVVGNCKWTTIDSKSNEFRFDNPEKKLCVVKIVDGKLYVNYEGQIEWYTDETSFLEAMATILDKMEPWAEKHFLLALREIRNLGIASAESEGMFEFSRGGKKCIVRLAGNKVSLEYNGSVGFYNDSKKLARSLAEIVVAMAVQPEARQIIEMAYEAVKFSLGEFPEVTVKEEKDGFTFTVESDSNIKLPVCSVRFVEGNKLEVNGYGVLEKFGSDDIKRLTVRVATMLQRLLATAEKVGEDHSWSQHLFRRTTQHLNKVQLAPNMEKLQGPGSYTLQTKDKRHGFNLSVSGERLNVHSEGDVRSFNKQTEDQMFNHLAYVLGEFRKHGKAN